MGLDKIIFLDIDGPMIPGTRYLENRMCSFEQDFCPRSVMVLTKILKASNAKVVFNSTHNLHTHPQKYDSHQMPGLLAVFEKHGLSEYLHTDYATSYPSPNHPTLWPANSESRRLNAIYEWLLTHYPRAKGANELAPNSVLWIAFDDEPMDHKRAFRIDFDEGLNLKAYNHAAKFLMFRGFM